MQSFLIAVRSPTCAATGCELPSLSPRQSDFTRYLTNANFFVMTTEKRIIALRLEFAYIKRVFHLSRFVQ